MNDITSTSFGLLIAYLLPGSGGLYALSFWFTKVGEVFKTFLTVQSNVGLFLLIVLAALTIGLIVAAARATLFERWFLKKDRLPKDIFEKLWTDETKLAFFRAAVDEYYRYHQFWGGMSIVMPLLYGGWLTESCSVLTRAGIVLSVLVFVAVEVLTVVEAVDTYKNFVVVVKKIQ
jgi:small-conductance mechanosensitive channel